MRCANRAVTYCVLILVAFCMSWASGAEPEEDMNCMSIPQLGEAVRAAAWNATIQEIPRSAVILTSCDLKVVRWMQ